MIPLMPTALENCNFSGMFHEAQSGLDVIVVCWCHEGVPCFQTIALWRDSKCHSFLLSVAFCVAVDQCTFIHRSLTKINSTTTAAVQNDQKINVDSLPSPAAVWVNDLASDYHAELCCPTKTWLCHNKYVVPNGSTPPCHINTNIT